MTNITLPTRTLPRTEILTVRMTAQEMREIKALASALEVTTSHVVRHVLLEMARQYFEHPVRHDDAV